MLSNQFPEAMNWNIPYMQNYWINNTATIQGITKVLQNDGF